MLKAIAVGASAGFLTLLANNLIEKNQTALPNIPSAVVPKAPGAIAPQVLAAEAPAQIQEAPIHKASTHHIVTNQPNANRKIIVIKKSYLNDEQKKYVNEIIKSIEQSIEDFSDFNNFYNNRVSFASRKFYNFE